MNLKCKIKNKEFNIVIGNTITDNYNETLDSGEIILDQIEKQDFKPFDDVYIYDGNFQGFNNEFYFESCDLKSYVTETQFGKYHFYNTNFYIDEADGSKFVNGGYILVKINNTIIHKYIKYNIGGKLTLIDQNTLAQDESQVIDGKYNLASYSFTLAGLTYNVIYCVYNKQATNVEKPTFYRHFLIDDYTEERLNLNQNLYKYKMNLMSETKYLEKIQLPNISITQPLNIDKKVSVYDYIVQFVNRYSTKRKYQIGTSNKWIEINKYSVDPELQDIFGDTYAPDFSLNNPTLKDVLSQLFLTKDRIPYVQDNVIKALDVSKRNGTFLAPANRVNYIEGSMSSSNYAQNLKRNYNQGLSQDNSAHLTEFLGFRNMDNGLMTIGNMRIETRFPIYTINKVYMCYYKKITLKNETTGVETPMMFLCKQDITQLVKVNEERNLLSQDWEDFSEDNVPSTIEELAQYKIATVGYDRGSNYIEGWGTKYSYVKDFSWFENTKTYVENIFSFMDRNYPLGINSYNFIKQQQDLGNQVIVPTSSVDNIISPFKEASKLKSFIFVVDYNAFYNGTVIHSKDNNFGDLCDNDNPSSSLTLVESDGIYEKEKINRLGNKILRINARYNSIDEVQELGSVYEDDYIVYSRTISIYPNFINVNYTLTKDYVLRSYFTSVWAKIRTYNLLSYGESVLRAENEKVFLLLSKNECYSQAVKKINFRTSQDINILLCNAFLPSNIATSKNYYQNDYKLNTGIFVFNGNKYESDINSFVSGYSLCFNIQMADNVSSGVYIKYPVPEFNLNADDEDKKTGSGQSWYLMVDDTETGKTKELGVYFAHIDQEESFLNTTSKYDESQISDLYNNLLFKLPQNNKIDINSLTNKIGQNLLVYKDNKEQLDFTFQIEPICRDDSILFSQWFMKLNDLLGNFQKVQKNYMVEDTSGADMQINLYASTEKNSLGSTGNPVIYIYLTDDDISRLEVGTSVTALVVWDQPSPTHLVDPLPHNFQITFNKIVEITSDSISFSCSMYYRQFFNIYESTDTNRKVTFNKVEQIGKTENGYLYVALFREYKVPEGNPTGTLSDLYNGYLIKYYLDLPSTTSSDVELPTSLNSKIVPLYVDIDSEVQTTTYEQNMFIYGSTEEFSKNLIYKELNESQISSLYTKIDVDVQSLFSPRIDETTNKPYIYIDLSLIDSTYKSIGYWFKNEKSNSYNFVFGVNISNEDRTNGYIKIYLSILNNNVLEVYDKNNNLIGEIHNFANDNENDFNNQIFDSII